jgi:hypothetical protein
MCLGIPSIVVSIAENQKSACEKLGRDGLVRYLGTQSSLKPGAIRDAVVEAKTKYASLFDQIERGQILVDGRGCERVAEVICPSDESELAVRLARPDDCVNFFNWANDPEVREQSLSTSTIQWSEHKKWFAEKISSSSSEMYVIEASGLPVGQVRFDLVDGTAEIDYSLDELVRGRGWAAIAVDLSVKCFRDQNAVPLKAFFKLGFSEISAVSPPPRTSIFYRVH